MLRAAEIAVDLVTIVAHCRSSDLKDARNEPISGVRVFVRMRVGVGAARAW